MVVAGLTGGIASGKSTVAAVLAAAGAQLIDADRIARELVRQGTPAYQQILAHFGRSILGSGGELDRRRLGALVFSDPQEKRVLEEIVHPGVRTETAQRLEAIRQAVPDAVVILDVPLLFEAGMAHDLDALIVVYVPEWLQIERLIARDHLTPAEALARIRAQMPLEQKRARATHVIDNSGTIEQTRSQALAIYRQLAAKAAERKAHRAIDGKKIHGS